VLSNTIEKAFSDNLNIIDLLQHTPKCEIFMKYVMASDTDNTLTSIFNKLTGK